MRRLTALTGGEPSTRNSQESARRGGLFGSGPCAGEAVGVGAGLDDRAVEGESVDNGRAEPGVAVRRGGGFFRGSGQTESTAFLTVRQDTLYLRSSSRILMPAR